MDVITCDMLIISILSVLFILLTGISIQDAYAVYFGQDISIATHLQNSLLLPKQISATEKGDVYVVWVDKNNIYFSSSHNSGSNFSQQVLLGNNKTSSSSLSPSFPQIAATEKGDVYVVWVDKNNIYFSSSHNSGSNFSQQVLLGNNKTSSSSLSPSFPQIAATEKGDVYVVWEDKDNKTGDSNIEFIGSNDSGINFSSKKEIRGGRTLSLSPQLSATENGKVYVVWEDKDNKTGDSNIEFIGSNDSGNTFSPNTKLEEVIP